MPHLEQPMDLHARKSLASRTIRLVFIALITSALFLIGLSIVVISTVD